MREYSDSVYCHFPWGYGRTERGDSQTMPPQYHCVLNELSKSSPSNRQKTQLPLCARNFRRAWSLAEGAKCCCMMPEQPPLTPGRTPLQPSPCGGCGGGCVPAQNLALFCFSAPSPLWQGWKEAVCSPTSQPATTLTKDRWMPAGIPAPASPAWRLLPIGAMHCCSCLLFRHG